MNDGLFDGIKKMFILPLTIELHDPKKVFRNAPVSPTLLFQITIGSVTLPPVALTKKRNGHTDFRVFASLATPSLQKVT